MIIRPPILIDIKKNSITARALNQPNSYVGDIYIWTKHEPGKKEIVTAVGKSYEKNDSSQHKIFYNNEHIVIDDFEKAAAVFKWLILSIPTKGFGALLKPIVILNVPYDLTQVEITALKESVTMAGAREIYILNEYEMPADRLFEANMKLPGKVVYGDDRYKSDEVILVILCCFFAFVLTMIFWRL